MGGKGGGGIFQRLNMESPTYRIPLFLGEGVWGWHAIDSADELGGLPYFPLKLLPPTNGVLF